MQVKRSGANYLVQLEQGEHVLQRLEDFAKQYRIGFATLSGIGMLQRVILGYHDAETNGYQKKALDEPVELLTLTGDITRGRDGHPTAYAQVILGRADFTTYGGHLVEGTVGPTLEIVIRPQPGTIRRRHDPDSNLQLWDLRAVETFSV